MSNDELKSNESVAIAGWSQRPNHSRPDSRRRSLNQPDVSSVSAVNDVQTSYISSFSNEIVATADCEFVFQLVNEKSCRSKVLHGLFRDDEDPRGF